ncbi:MAG: redox-sensing transcriptional repressor Rex [Bacteroidetes bacterium]|jgi:redox-sensing transcriptional repressor|nr:redox-sensing transcriptional repressor Rex [Bacteroidota bacterium]RLD54760.1 MAG: redox-sensing transcriptional repressor Rex [Bacteroidota bacterium]RLD91130.1 MAG: redox-sensing transcriptional repressor Rex [Bacteroidota bacterium]
MTLPERTVERLSEYRRSLLQCLEEGKTHIFSHELANLHHNTAVQVRRDIMFIGYTSMQRKGYDVRELVDVIGEILDSEMGLNVAVIGIGNLGRAFTTYFVGKRSKLNIIATFDVDTTKIDRVISGVKCYPLNRLKEVVETHQISIAILTVPADSASEVAAQLVEAGIKGLMNFTTIPLNVPNEVFLDEYDMITSVEKVAYFVKSPRE